MLTISAAGLRTINKLGLNAAMEEAVRKGNHGVEFLKLESFGCVLAVFCGHVAGGAGHSACLMLGALS